MKLLRPALMTRRALLITGAASCCWRRPDVEVSFDISDPRFPNRCNYIASPEEAQIGALEGVERFLSDIRHCHRRHPMLTMIGLCGWMYSDIGPIGGTYDKDGGYVFSTTRSNPTKAAPWVRGELHHEYSSLLIYAGLVDLAAWARISGQDAYQVHETLERMRTRAGVTHTDHSAGFISVYSRTTPENDFNTFAEVVVTRPLLVDRIAKHNPKVAAKRDLLVAIYTNLGIL